MVRQVLARPACLARSIAAIAILAFLTLPQLVAHAQDATATMTAALELSQSYQPGAWQPVRLQLRNASDRAIDGATLLPLADPQSPALMRLPVIVPPRSSVTVTLWGYFPRAKAPPQKPSQRTPQSKQPQQDHVLPLTVAEWRGSDGALLARAEVMGFPVGGHDGTGSSGGEFVLVVAAVGTATDETRDAEALAAHLTENTGTAIAIAAIEPQTFTRQPGTLRSIKAIIFDGLDPSALDVAQREVLQEYLSGGGIVVMAAPDRVPGDVAAASTAPLLPVRVVGRRVAAQVEAAPGGPVLKLRQPIEIVEAVERGSDSHVLLRDRDYVHVAARSVGLGKVVFASFPINALDPAQPQTALLWEQLLALRETRRDWNATQLGDVRHEIVGGMIGRPVAPWRIAAWIAAGYVLVIGAAQLFFFGPARPRAFVVSVAAAGVLSAALVAMGVARRSESRLQSARLGIVDVAPDGGGWARESVAYVGADVPNMKLEAADEAVMLRPAMADARNRATVRQQPFRAENAQVFVDRIERVWEAAGPAAPAAPAAPAGPAGPAGRIIAAAQFGGDGLTLDVDNAIGATISAPLLVWNGRSVAMADLPRGRTAVRAFEFNPRGEFTGLDAIASDQSKRRARIIAASLAPANELEVTNPADAPAMLVGWIDEAAAPLVRGGGGNDATVAAKSMVMVRTPLRVNVAQPGSAVTIPAPLVQLDSGRLPYDRAKGESVPTPQGGSWRIRFAPPRQTGRVKPSRVTVAARVTLPAHTLRLTMPSRAANDAPLEWSRKVGTIETTIDCGERDYDADGRITMTLDIEQLDPTSTVTWQISDLVAKIDGVITGPPAPIVLDATTTRPADQSETESAQEK